jgi:hypothetical protein
VVQAHRPRIPSREKIGGRLPRFDTCLPRPKDSVRRRYLHLLRSLPPVSVQ